MLPRITEDTSEDEFIFLVQEWLRVELQVSEERRQVANFLEEAVSLQKEELIQAFVELMQQEIPHEAEMPYLAYILTHKLSQDVLDAIVQVFDPEYYDMVSGLLTSINEDHISIGISNIKTIFEGIPLDKTALELLYSVAYEKGLVQLVDYLSQEIEENDVGYAGIPEWIIPDGRTHSQLVNSLVIPIPQRWKSTSLHEDAAYITSLVEEDKDLDDVYQQLLIKLESFTIFQREEMISGLIKQNQLLLLTLNEEIFRVLGPCLPMGEAYELKIKSRDPCSMYGGCRVHTCYENENINQDTDEPIVEDPVGTGMLSELEWFSGRCANPECRLFIRKKHYAVRIPTPNGGWLGCYCSFFCVRAVAGDENSTLTRLIAGFEGQYLMHGIYDRR